MTIMPRPGAQDLGTYAQEKQPKSFFTIGAGLNEETHRQSAKWKNRGIF